MKIIVFLVSILIFYDTSKIFILEYKKNKLGSFFVLIISVLSFLLPNFIIFLYY